MTEHPLRTGLGTRGLIRSRPLTFAALGMCLCFGLLFARAWIEAMNKGSYLAVFLWGAPLLIALVLLVFRIGRRE